MPRIIALSLIFLQVALTACDRTETGLQSAKVSGTSSRYATNFDLTESPISEGGAWRRANNAWTNVNTANGIAFGTNGALNTYDDSYAVLSGFGPDQQAQAVVFRSPGLRNNRHDFRKLQEDFPNTSARARSFTHRYTRRQRGVDPYCPFVQFRQEFRAEL